MCAIVEQILKYKFVTYSENTCLTNSAAVSHVVLWVHTEVTYVHYFFIYFSLFSSFPSGFILLCWDVFNASGVVFWMGPRSRKYILILNFFLFYPSLSSFEKNKKRNNFAVFVGIWPLTFVHGGGIPHPLISAPKTRAGVHVAPYLFSILKIWKCHRH